MTDFTKRALQWVVIFALTLYLTLPTVAAWKHDRTSVLQDFASFYCAGATKNAGGNPYLTADLDRCGAGAAKPRYEKAHRPPAPLPGYDVALFRGIAHLSYGTASLLWLFGCALALLIAVACAGGVTGIPPLIVFAALALPMRDPFSVGQFSPFVLALVSAAAFAIKQQRTWVAGALAAVTLVEPHVGAPVCLAVFVWLPGARLALAVMAALLAASSLATLGIAGNLAYFRNALPLHIAAEAPFTIQYSLTWLLYVCGVPESLAAKLGTLWYYAGVVAALYVTRRLPREFVPVVPAAFAVLGGPFIHSSQVHLAVVAALMLAAYFGAARAWLAVTTLAVVWFDITWKQHHLSITRVAGCIVVALIVAYATRLGSLRARLSASLGSAALYFALSEVIIVLPFVPLRYPEHQALYSAAQRVYASVPWGEYTHLHADVSSLFEVVRKVPVWLGLGLVAFEAWQAARSRIGYGRTSRADASAGSLAAARLHAPFAGRSGE